LIPVAFSRASTPVDLPFEKIPAAKHQGTRDNVEGFNCTPHNYRVLRHRGKTHHQALGALANRLVGILRGCLDRRQTYREGIAWPRSLTVAA
jgi:hypothetical protein